jgi:hypothetical protein
MNSQSFCGWGIRLMRVLRVTPRQWVLSLVLGDIKENPFREYLKILRCLGVPNDGGMNPRSRPRPSLPVHDCSKCC